MSDSQKENQQPDKKSVAMLVVERGEIPMLESFKAALHTALRKPLPEEAKVAYSDQLTGYKVQAYFDRLNSVLGVSNWTYSYREVNDETVNGDAGVALTVEVTLVVPVFNLRVSQLGVHADLSRAAALRGAVTNGFKAACSKSLGIGAEAYLGLLTMDEDSETLKVTPKVESAVDLSMLSIDTSTLDKPEEPKAEEVKAESPKTEAIDESKGDAKNEEKQEKKPKKVKAKEPVPPVEQVETAADLAAQLEGAAKNGNGHSNNGDSH
ncbi:MAG: hypothetical protein M1378_11355 [Bacteroidetes bacterium]|nr:hypothetical protein [Bacteroidota bacterium]